MSESTCGEEKLHPLKRISGWHYVYVILILVLIIIGIVAYNYSGCNEIVALVSFAATISSIILSVLAIFITVVSGESTNKLRDSLVMLKTIPTDVKEAISSTIDKMNESSTSLAEATQHTSEGLKAIENKFKRVEFRLAQQDSKLNIINDRLIKNNAVVDSDENGQLISEEIIKEFLENTSVLSLHLMSAFARYASNNSGSAQKFPIVHLAKLTLAINNNKEDNAMAMYLFACMVILSSFGLLSYENDNNNIWEFRINSIDARISSKLDEEMDKREVTIPEKDNRVYNYIDSLFNGNAENEEEYGTEAN